MRATVSLLVAIILPWAVVIPVAARDPLLLPVVIVAMAAIVWLGADDIADWIERGDSR